MENKLLDAVIKAVNNDSLYEMVDSEKPNDWYISTELQISVKSDGLYLYGTDTKIAPLSALSPFMKEKKKRFLDYWKQH